MTSRALAGAVAFAAALSITGQAQAGNAWAPPAPMTPTTDMRPAGVSIAPDGTVTSAGSRGEYPQQSNHHVEVRTKPPGGGFGPPQTLTTTAEADVRMVGDAAGNVAVVWTTQVAGIRALRGTTRPAGGSFGPVRAISDTGSDSNSWDVEIAGGNVLVSWVQNQRLRAATATVGSAFEVGDPLTGLISPVRDPEAALAPNGAAVITWIVPTPAGRAVQAVARPAGGTFAKLSDLAQVPSSSGGEGSQRVSISDEGRATAVWSYRDDASNRWVLLSASRGKAGDFGGVETVDTAENYNGGTFGLETAPDGTSLLLWSDGESAKLRFAIRPDGSGFGPTQTVAGAVARSSPPTIAFGAADEAHAVWYSNYQGMQSMQTARIRMDGTVTPVQNIGIPSLQPGIISNFNGAVLDADAAGNAALAWTLGTDIDPGIGLTYKWVHEVRIFDTTPPVISAVQVPATALTGVPVPMSVTAMDSLTPIMVRWKLSKYVTLNGPSIAPSYPTPGPNGVSIEVTDAVGHQAFTSRAFQVEQNPAPPPPVCPEGQVCQ